MVEQWLETIPPLAVYLIVAVAIGVESLGIPLPGEIVLVAAALLASHHDGVNPVWLGGCAAFGAIAGDSGGYLLGRERGDRLFAWAGRRFPRHFRPELVDRARERFLRHGAWAVFLGRFVALLRILSGPLAGSLRMPYGRFLAANALGGIVWAGGTTALVYLLGTVAERWLARFSWVALLVALAVAVLAAVLVRRRAGSGR